MPVSCHFQGCKVLLHTIKRRYIKYHASAFLFLVITSKSCPDMELSISVQIFNGVNKTLMLDDVVTLRACPEVYDLILVSIESSSL